MTREIPRAIQLHRQGRLAEAGVIYRSILGRNPDQFDALHLLGLVQFQQGNSIEAQQLISRAVAVRPQSWEALSNLASVLLALDRPEEALAACDRAIALASGDARSLYNRGVALTRLGRLDEALAAYDEALRSKADDASALFNRGNLLATLERYDEALASFEKALSFAPRFLDALVNRGNVLIELGRGDEALESFERVLALDPRHVNALNNRGNLLRRSLRHEEALGCYDMALAAAPGRADVLNNRANTLLELGRPAEALAIYERVVAAGCKDPELINNRGSALFALGRYQEVIESSDRVSAIDPNFAAAWVSRGSALSQLNRPDEAAASYERALAIEPHNPYAFGNVGQCYLSLCDWPKVAAFAGQMRERLNAATAVVPPLTLHELDTTPAEQLKWTRQYVQTEFPAGNRSPERLPPHSDKIRIAYLSGDFRRHAVSYAIAGVIERHDRARFDAIGISFGPDDRSEMRSRLVGAFDQFHDVTAWDTSEVARLLRDLQVTIAVDLMGYTNGCRPGILALRPAPIQVNAIGYPGTMGADFIDYVIADRFALPFEQQQFYTEKIVHLPDCFLPHDATRRISPRTPSRAEAELPERGFVFCAFTNPAKITAAMFDVWMNLLNEIEGGVLWLSRASELVAANLRCAAEIRGVDPGRLVFAVRLEANEDHLARHRLADLYLDTLPYNAHSTAGDALWAGLPLVTCSGNSFASRAAGSQLCALGVPELVTNSLAEYQALASRLAGEPGLLRAIGAKIEQNRLRSPLFDMERYCRHIEAAYTTMRNLHRRGESPRSFSVDAIKG